MVALQQSGCGASRLFPEFLVFSAGTRLAFLVGMNTLLATLEIPYYAVVDFALGAPREAMVLAAVALAAVFGFVALV